ncbi:MAG: iron-regulated protein [Deltaproteobacteria bacterium]|nr:iron-regulated protein [Deltaproteobacteria bacterium]
MKVIINIAAWAALMSGCSDGGSTVSTRAVVEHYAAIVHANYAEALTNAQALEVAVEAFVAAPRETTLAGARQAWKAAREPYGQSEVYRFYDGPIDDPASGPEGRMNAWPLDEVFIDYVVDDEAAGIINHPELFPTLTLDVIAAQNEAGGEKNISTGYHAIEFLLWGQDLDPQGAGARPPTDYVAGGTHANQARRAQYLTLVTEQLVADLQMLVDAWQPDTANYAAALVAGDPADGLANMLLGMGSLSGAELAGERMTTAIDNRDQEDEHSCFSDNTHRDLALNALAIENVYFGRYGAIDGAGLDDLVKAIDPELDAKLTAQFAATHDAIAAIPVPFDQAIASEAGRTQALAAVQALKAQTTTIVEVATALGIAINIED